MVQSDNRKYAKLIYDMMLNDLEIRAQKQNWALSVKNLLYRLGFGDVWVAQGVGKINTFIKILKIRVKDIFMQEWHSRLENSTRARFYFHISDFRYQPYLDILHIQK